MVTDGRAEVVHDGVRSATRLGLDVEEFIMGPAGRSLSIALRRCSLVLIAVLGVMGTPGASAQESPQSPWFIDTACREYTDSVVRLYTAAFGRQPDQGGFQYWLDQYQQGHHSLPSMAEFFADSPEFVATYGALSDQLFVEQLYRNVLNREGDVAGIGYWRDQLDGLLTRGDVLLRFSESPENVEISGTVEPRLGFYNEGHDGAFGCLFSDGESFLSPDGSILCTGIVSTVSCKTVGEPFDNEPVSPDCPKMAVSIATGSFGGWVCSNSEFFPPSYAPSGPAEIYFEISEHLGCSVTETLVVCHGGSGVFRIEENRVSQLAFS